MSTPNHHSFSAAFPFEIKIENQFMNEGHSTLYIVNKVDAASTEQHLKLLINTVAFGHYALKGYGTNMKPGPNQYNLALTFRPGTLLKSLEDNFHKVLVDAFNEVLKDKDNSCQVSKVVTNKDHSKVWYVCFEEDITSIPTQEFSLSASPFLSNDPTIEFYHVTGGPDGSYYAIDTSNELYHYPLQGSQWIKYDQWGGLVKSIVAMPNKQFHYIGINNHLNLATDKPDGLWKPYDAPAIQVQNNARYGASDLIGVDPSGHLIKITFGDANPTIEVFSNKKSLISACALPNGQILGVDTQNSLHLWHEAHDSWTSINTTNHQKFLMVSVDYNNQLLAVGTDHQLYQLGYAAVTQNLLTVDLKGISAEAGNGTRVTQMACQFDHVTKGADTPTFQFKSTTQLNIVNHQGAGYAPLHFGVLGNDVMVAGETNTLKPYFFTKERLPIQLNKKTTITFSFPYPGPKKETPSFGTAGEVNAIYAKQPKIFQLVSDHEKVQDKESFKAKDDPARHQVQFTFQGKDVSELYEEVFDFVNIQVSSYHGPVMVEVAIKNLPGYWDSVFQIPVVIGGSALTDVLSLARTVKSGGNSNSTNSKIYFNSAGFNGDKPHASIEEHYGINIYTVNKKYQNVRVLGGNLLIPEGGLAIGAPKAKDTDPYEFPEDSKKSLYVKGESEFQGYVFMPYGFTTHGNTLRNQEGWTVICKDTSELPPNSKIDGGLTIGYNRHQSHGDTTFYNTYAPELPENKAFQFTQLIGNNKSRDLLTILRNGRVGIGTSDPKVPLHVQGYTGYLGKIQTKQYSALKWWEIDKNVIGDEHLTKEVTAPDVAICASGIIISSKVSQTSDARIKGNKRSSNQQLDLERLLKIRITDYYYIDHVQHGRRREKGLIAQEVAEVFPEAVHEHTDFIPNIYCECLDFSIDEAQHTLTSRMDKPHDLQVGDLIKLTDEKNEVYEKEVTAIQDEHTFVLQAWTTPLERLFIYGKQVDDFRTVDYQQVAMLGISATQALHQEVQNLKVGASNLTEQVEGLRKENVDLKLENLTLKQGYEHMQQENAALKAQLMNEMQSLRAEMEAMKVTSM